MHVLNSLSIPVSQLLESNLRPTDYKSVALPAELRWRYKKKIKNYPKNFGNAKVMEFNKYKNFADIIFSGSLK